MSVTIDHRLHFELPNDRIWLSASHQGPLPTWAVEAGHRALKLKQQPFNVSTSARFNEVPQTLRATLATLLNASPDNILLGNSASHGLHQIAHSMQFQSGDEVLLVEDDFPSTIFPWLFLEKQGVIVRRIKPSATALTADELRDQLKKKTRVFCTTWVHSFTGHALDIEAIGVLCCENKTRFIVNASQVVGSRHVDVSRLPIDALVGVGFKWLCGPYGTGYGWIGDALLAEMSPVQTYWLAHLTADELQGNAALEPKGDVGIRAYDIFGTANFNNYMPWTASLNLLLEIGLENIESHNQSLVTQLVDGLLAFGFVVKSPRRSGIDRSSIVIASHSDIAKNQSLYDHLRKEGIDITLRKGHLRFAPHFYNTTDEIERTLQVIEDWLSIRA